jgi:hypothetical protein
MEIQKSEENNKKIRGKNDLHPKMTHILTEHG